MTIVTQTWILDLQGDITFFWLKSLIEVPISPNILQVPTVACPHSRTCTYGLPGVYRDRTVGCSSVPGERMVHTNK